MLAGKDQQRVIEPGSVERGERLVVELGELQTGDHRAKRGVERLDLEAGGAHQLRILASRPPRTSEPGSAPVWRPSSNVTSPDFTV